MVLPDTHLQMRTSVFLNRESLGTWFLAQPANLPSNRYPLPARSTTIRIAMASHLGIGTVKVHPFAGVRAGNPLSLRV